MGERQQSDNTVDGKPASPVVEVYVPIYGENGKELLGVFETYRRPDAIFRAVHDDYDRSDDRRQTGEKERRTGHATRSRRLLINSASRRKQQRRLSDQAPFLFSEII